MFGGTDLGSARVAGAGPQGSPGTSGRFTNHGLPRAACLPKPNTVRPTPRQTAEVTAQQDSNRNTRGRVSALPAWANRRFRRPAARDSVTRTPPSARTPARKVQRPKQSARLPRRDSPPRRLAAASRARRRRGSARARPRDRPAVQTAALPLPNRGDAHKSKSYRFARHGRHGHIRHAHALDENAARPRASPPAGRRPRKRRRVVGCKAA